MDRQLRSAELVDLADETKSGRVDQVPLRLKEQDQVHLKQSLVLSEIFGVIFRDCDETFTVVL